MALISSNNNQPPPVPATESYDSFLQSLVKAGWVVTSEGPSGAQLTGRKRMRGLDQLALVGGAVLVIFFWPVGLFLMLLAVIDYTLLTKAPTHFLSRSNPQRP
ncbi:MAG TPA: hypothetical protein VHF69_11665 [Candidatus Synoicihabitans sp.]|nr:hypothetical protein [Candidatus Synoicihabitans sp.]